MLSKQALDFYSIRGYDTSRTKILCCRFICFIQAGQISQIEQMKTQVLVLCQLLGSKENDTLKFQQNKYCLNLKKIILTIDLLIKC